MTTRTVSIHGTPVDIVPSGLDLSNARLMLGRFGEAESRDAFAEHMAAGLDANVAVWLEVHGERVAVAMARIAVAVGEVHAQLVPGGAR